MSSYQTYQQWKTTPIDGEPYLSVVIPAYNEEERIIPTIGAIVSHVSSLGFPWELVIADDGSKDATIALVEGLEFVNLRLLKATKNAGKGSAVQRGVLAAKGHYILFADADNSTPIEQVDKLLIELEKGTDIALGSRAAKGAEEDKKSFLRHLMSTTLRLLNRSLLGIQVKDTQCGFKAYKHHVAHHLHQMQTVMGFSFDLEILYLAHKFDYQVLEIPVQWRDAPGSKVDPLKDSLRFVKDMAKIIFNNLEGRYEFKPEPLLGTSNPRRVRS